MNSEQMEESKNPKFLVVPVRDIRLSHDRLRRIMDQDAIDRMKLSLTMVGQLQPIGVRRHGNGWILIFGHLRLHAAKQLGWKIIQTMEFPETENTELVDLALWASENLYSSAPKLDEIAVTVSKLADAGMSNSVIALALGKPADWVAGMLSLARDPLARGLVETGKLADFDAWLAFNQLTTQARKAMIYGAEGITSRSCENAALQSASKRGSKKHHVQNIAKGPLTLDLWPDLVKDGIKHMKHSDVQPAIGALRKINNGR